MKRALVFLTVLFVCSQAWSQGWFQGGTHVLFEDYYTETEADALFATQTELAAWGLDDVTGAGNTTTDDILGPDRTVLTATGFETAAANDTYVQSGTYGGKPYFTGVDSDWVFYWSGSTPYNWVLTSGAAGGPPDYYSDETDYNPEQVETWYDYAGDSTSAGTLVASSKEVNKTVADLEDAVNNAVPGQTIFIAPGTYALTANLDHTTECDIVVPGAEGGNRAVLTGAYSFTIGYVPCTVEGLDVTGLTPANFQFTFTTSATEQITLRYCDVGDYAFEYWDGKTSNVDIESCTIGLMWVGDPTTGTSVNAGDIKDSTIGFDFCNNSTNTGTIRNTTFSSTASTLIATGGTYINCVDSNGVLFSTPDVTLNGALTADTVATDMIKLIADPLLTTEETGAMEYDGESLFFTPADKRRSVNLADGIILTDTTVANTVTETTVFTESIGAGELHAGQVVKVNFAGKYNTANATDTFTIAIKIGGTEVNSFTSTAANVTDGPFSVDMEFTVRTDGATGTVVSKAVGFFDGKVKQCGNVGITTTDTTTAEDVTVTVTWSAANVSNTLTVMQGHGEFIH